MAKEEDTEMILLGGLGHDIIGSEDGICRSWRRYFFGSNCGLGEDKVLDFDKAEGVFKMFIVLSQNLKEGK